MNVETMLCPEVLIGCVNVLGPEVLNTEPDNNEIRDNAKPGLYGL